MIEVLSWLVSVHGSPRHLRSDNGPEFVSRAVLKWLLHANIDTAHIDPGKPWQNGSNESFNGKFRDECLSLEWLRSRHEAGILIEAWRRHYNAVRPHQSLNYLTPIEFKQHHQPQPVLQPPSHFPGIERSKFPRQVTWRARYAAAARSYRDHA